MLSSVATSASLLRATDTAKLRPVFERELSSAWSLPVRIADFFVPRVQVRGSGELLVQYRFSAAGRSWIFWGHVGSESPDRYGGHAFKVPELDLVVPVFPFDPDLPALARFFRRDESARLLEDLRVALDLTAGARIEDVALLGYRVGRRAVLRCHLRDRGRERTVVAKVLPPRKAVRVGHLMRELARGGFDGAASEAIRTPRIVAESAHGILWLEDCRERSLHDRVGEPSFVPACGGAACALRRLHATAIPGLSAWDVETELAQLRTTVTLTARLVPDLATGLCQATGRLESNAPGPPPSTAALHRDFYDKQILTGASGTTLLDVDTLAAGDPAQDVGNFLAHLVVRSRQDPASAVVLAEGREVFLAEYGDVSKARCRFWEAASLARLSCIYSLRPRWRALAVPLLEESRQRFLVRGGAHA